MGNFRAESFKLKRGKDGDSMSYARYIEGAEDLMAIEELRYVRMHSNLGYLVLKDQGY